MNNTKTIFKSLLIMIVAISLFTVSCSKDEGGTKNPTNPTIVKVSADMITKVLQDLGPLKGTGQDATTTMVDFSNINPENGSAAIADANQSFGKVKSALDILTTPQTILTVTTDLASKQKPGNQKEELIVNIEFKANGGYEFDTTITKPEASATKYTYEESTKKAKLKLKITPANNWTD